MKTLTADQKTDNLYKIEKNTDQILKTLNKIPPGFFAKEIHLSKKAEEEKSFLSKNLLSKQFFNAETSIQSFIRILEDPDFSKLEKEDQDFISGLEKIDLKNSQYLSEISAFVSSEANAQEILESIVKESIYFNLLSSELYNIESKLREIRLKP